MNYKNWSHIYPKYAGKWITFAEDEVTVISNAKSLKTAISKAKKTGIKNPLAFKVPQQLSYYVG